MDRVGMGGSIWKVDRTTGVAYELTNVPQYHASPMWSADGHWIIYTADEGGDTIQLEILNAESGQTHALTNDAFVYTDPVFSPDDTRIAYVSTIPNGYLNVYGRPIKDGSWSGSPIAVTSATDDSGNRGMPPPLYLEPTWTRDGK
jgi:TolB protein